VEVPNPLDKIGVIMASETKTIESIISMAEMMPGAVKGTSCNQTSFKVGKTAFLYIGPGAKGIGFKAMFKLDESMQQANELSSENPDRFEVGSTGWITTRFTSENPLPKKIWSTWLRESFNLSSK
jgi:hypothetical protein